MGTIYGSLMCLLENNFGGWLPQAMQEMGYRSTDLGDQTCGQFLKYCPSMREAGQGSQAPGTGKWQESSGHKSRLLGKPDNYRK